MVEKLKNALEQKERRSQKQEKSSEQKVKSECLDIIHGISLGWDGNELLKKRFQDLKGLSNDLGVREEEIISDPDVQKEVRKVIKDQIKKSDAMDIVENYSRPSPFFVPEDSEDAEKCLEESLNNKNYGIDNNISLLTRKFNISLKEIVREPDIQRIAAKKLLLLIKNGLFEFKSSDRWVRGVSMFKSLFVLSNDTLLQQQEEAKNILKDFLHDFLLSFGASNAVYRGRRDNRYRTECIKLLQDWFPISKEEIISDPDFQNKVKETMVSALRNGYIDKLEDAQETFSVPHDVYMQQEFQEAARYAMKKHIADITRVSSYADRRSIDFYHDTSECIRLFQEKFTITDKELKDDPETQEKAKSKISSIAHYFTLDSVTVENADQEIEKIKILKETLFVSEESFSNIAKTYVEKCFDRALERCEAPTLFSQKIELIRYLGEKFNIDAHKILENSIDIKNKINEIMLRYLMLGNVDMFEKIHLVVSQNQSDIEPQYLLLAKKAMEFNFSEGSYEKIKNIQEKFFPQMSISEFLEERYRHCILIKDWGLVFSLIHTFADCYPIYHDFIAEQTQIARDGSLTMVERQESFAVLSELAKSGDSVIIDEFVDVIESYLKQKEGASNARLGLDEIQESAFHTLMLLDNPDAHATLFKLIQSENVHTDIKHAVLRKLLRNDSSFFNAETREVLRYWFYSDRSKEVDFNDLRFFEAVQKIPSGDLRRSALQSFSVLKKYKPNSFSLHKEWQENLYNIPENTFIQLFGLVGSARVWYQFQELFTAIRNDNRIQENLLYGITKVLEVEPQILSLLVEKLKDVEFRSKEDAELLSDLLRRVIFLDNIKGIQDSGYQDDYYDDYDSEYGNNEGQMSEEISLMLREIFSHKVQDLRGITALLSEATTKRFQEILPHKDITDEKIEAVEKWWGDMEPILTYLGRYPDLKDYVAEVVAHSDSEENWKAWRYDSRRGREVDDQIGHLSGKQLAFWRDDYFSEVGEVMASEFTDKPKRIQQLLHDAIVRDCHIFDSEENKSDDKYIQQTLTDAFEKVAEGPHEREVVIAEALQSVQSDARHIDAVIHHSTVSRLENSISMLAKAVTPSAKVKNTIGFLANHLPSDMRKELHEHYTTLKGGETTPLLTSAMKDALNKKIHAIKEQFKKSLNSDIWERFGLDKNNTKNQKPFYEKRQQLKIINDTLQLSNISTRNIALNQIVEKETKRGGESLTVTVDRLKKHFGPKVNKKGETIQPESPFYLDLKNIESILSEQSNLNEKRRLAILFTDNPQILWQVGKYPIGSGSCQHYAEGSFAQNLMGYVGDPNCKAAYIVDINKLPQHTKEVIDEKGFDMIKDAIPSQDMLMASVSRSMIKMARDAEDNPVILIEPSYGGNKNLDNYLNLFIDLALADPMQAKMARQGGNERIITGSSVSPEGQYEDTDLDSIRFIHKRDKSTQAE